MITESGREIELEVDGGVNLDNLREVIEAGADVIVAGSAVFGGSIEENVTEFKKIMNEYE